MMPSLKFLKGRKATYGLKQPTNTAFMTIKQGKSATITSPYLKRNIYQAKHSKNRHDSQNEFWAYNRSKLYLQNEDKNPIKVFPLQTEKSQTYLLQYSPSI